MRQPSRIVSGLIILAGAFFVYVSIQTAQYLGALAVIWGFGFIWAALYSVGRDPNLTDKNAQKYFRIVVFSAAAIAVISICGGVYFLIQGNYSKFAASISSIAWLIWAFQKYRQNLSEWMGFTKHAVEQEKQQSEPQA
jgi:hypothetical protein